MFGYIKPVPAELKVKEYELYRSIYCGLCSALGSNTSCVSRLTLSYDFVFLALVRMSLAGETGRIEKRRCLAHPTKRRAVLTGAPQLDYCARISAVLTYHKVLDDIADDRGWKRLSSRLLLPAAKMIRKRAEKGVRTAQPDIAPLDTFISGKLAELSNLERENILSPDRAAELFGDLMAAVSSYGFESGGTSARIAETIGRHIGRFIYIADAADDLAADLKSGAYNPFRIPDGDSMVEFEKNTGAVRNSLTMELIGIERAVELMDFSSVPEYGSIVKNIIYLGLPSLIERILTKKKSDCSSVMENNNI